MLFNQFFFIGIKSDLARNIIDKLPAINSDVDKAFSAHLALDDL